MSKKKDLSKMRLNTSETLAYIERTKNNSRKQRMRTSITDSKSSRVVKNTYHCVNVPDKAMYYVENMEDPDEAFEVYDWWAESIVDFLNEVQMMYVSTTSNNVEWTGLLKEADLDISKGYPEETTFFWKLTPTSEPEIFKVDKYVNHLLDWNQQQIENPLIFPATEEDDFSPDFPRHMQKMFRRMFRIFQIIYANDCLRKNINQDSKYILKHFCYFGWKWDLLTEKDTRFMSKYTDSIREKFLRDQALYLSKNLPMN